MDLLLAVIREEWHWSMPSAEAILLGSSSATSLRW